MSATKAMLIGTLAVMVPVTGSAFIGGPSGDDETAIRAVLEDYLNGVAKQDAAMLEKAFDAGNAHMKFVAQSDDGAEALRVMPIREAFANWTKPPAKPCKGRVLNLDTVDGRMAVAKYEFLWGDVTFIDYLTLYKINGDWKIVNKVFVRQAG